MNKKFRMILAMMLAALMMVLVSVPSIAEEPIENDVAPQIHDAIETDAPAETPEEDESEDEEEFFEFDDDNSDWGYVDPDLIAEFTPEMTQEFIHADDEDIQADMNDAANQEPAEEIPSEEPEAENTEDPVPEATDVPEVTEAPAEEAAPEETEAPAEEPELNGSENEADQPEAQDESEDAQETPISITIVTTMTGENEMKLSAVVEDPENREYAFQWQVSKDGGENYEDITDETLSELEIVLDENNINDLWRVKAHIV